MATPVLLVAAMVLAAGPRPSLMQQVDDVAGARFGMAEICIPAVAADTQDPELFSSLLRVRKPPYPGQTSYYVGPDVTISTKGKSCTVRASSGSAPKLREAVLAALNAAGTEIQVKVDSGPEGRDGAGRYRQEAYCLSLGARRAYFVLSTSPERGRTPLQATLGLDDGRTCPASAPDAVR